jgi:GNAT superfamily N-acetyltransferase
MISAATLGDADELAALRCAVALEMTLEYGEGDWSARPSKAEVVRQLRASHVLVARRDARIIGTVRLARPLIGAFDSSAFTPVEKPLYVLGLAVAPQFRGRGEGRQLMAAANDAARKVGAQALWLDAYDHEAGAGPFYMKCGFARVGVLKHRGVPLICFESLLVRTGPP